MSTHHASAQWKGKLSGGQGKIHLGNGVKDMMFSADSRFSDGKGVNPEELIGAAEAGCYSMALSHMLESAGFTPRQIDTEADVQLEKQGDGFAITGIRLTNRSSVEGIDEEKFRELAEQARQGCVISKALGGTEIRLEAHLE